jgi:predicted 3-demethylubiquinone-9 3-methyltransferase (glyoxalase superfamily)
MDSRPSLLTNKHVKVVTLMSDPRRLPASSSVDAAKLPTSTISVAARPGSEVRVKTEDSKRTPVPFYASGDPLLLTFDRPCLTGAFVYDEIRSTLAHRSNSRRRKLMLAKQRIAPCLWFDNQAEEAAAFYVSIFKNSKVHSVARYGKAGFEVHKKPAGSVMTVEFELDGQPFTALNGGPHFKFSEAVSLQVFCETQIEVDYYWEKLSKGGDPKAQQCGWLKDKYGLSWQIVPRVLPELLLDNESEKAQRAMEAMLHMKKIDIGDLERAVAAKMGS